MHSAPHRNNSNFQLRHFIAGACHTPDAAWSVLYEQMIDIKIKLAATEAKLLRRKSQEMDFEERKKYINTEQEKLKYEADLIEFMSGYGLLELAIEGAKKELECIVSLMKELEPYRKYKHLPILEATEAAQQDEWREEFKHRIENFLLGQGFIPADQLEAIRRHPDFETHILPHIKKTMVMLEDAKSTSNAVMLLTRTNLLLEGGTHEQSA